MPGDARVIRWPLDRLSDLLPVFTRRDVDALREVSRQAGYLTGYRQGCEDARRIDALRRGGDIVFPGDPVSKPTLRRVK